MKFYSLPVLSFPLFCWLRPAEASGDSIGRPPAKIPGYSATTTELSRLDLDSPNSFYMNTCIIPDTLKIHYLSKNTRQDCALPHQSNRHRNTDSAKQTPYAMNLSAQKFDSLVDSCTTLLETEKVSTISDSGHVYIILCSNTIFYTRIRESKHCDQRFAGGRYERFKNALLQSSYVWNLCKQYAQCMRLYQRYQ